MVAKKKSPKHPRLTDRERILMTALRHLASTQSRLVLRRGALLDDDVAFEGGFVDRLDLRPGDLVQACTTYVPNHYSFAYFVRWHDDRGTALLREIGSQRTCRYGNESFYRLKGLRPEETWDGARHRFYETVQKAFHRRYGCDPYAIRFGGLAFDENDRALITGRPYMGGSTWNPEHKIWVQSLPKTAPPMAWTGRTTIRAVQEHLQTIGWPKPEWDLEPIDVALEREKRGR